MVTTVSTGIDIRQYMTSVCKWNSTVVYLRHYIGVLGSPIIWRLRIRHTNVTRRFRNVIVVCDCVNGQRDLSQRTLPRQLKVR